MICRKINLPQSAGDIEQITLVNEKVNASVT